MQMRIGYWASWSVSRECDIFRPLNIDPMQYTHINFAFAIVNENNRLAPANPGDVQLYRELQNLKLLNPKLRTMIAVGGWAFNDPPTHNRFSTMVSSREHRATFMQSAIAFMQQYGFDGIDIDWENPGADDRGGVLADTDNFSALLTDFGLALAFDTFIIGKKYSLSVTLPASYWYLRHFDVEAISKAVDWMNVMMYDIHGMWDANIKSLGPYVQGHTNWQEIDAAINMLRKAGANPAKLVLGLATYGRGFTLKDPSCRTPGCPFSGPSRAQPCTDTPGILAYTEIKNVVQGGGVATYNDTSTSYYAVYDGDQWVGYDDTQSIAKKLELAKQYCMGGVMVWSVDMDSPGDNSLIGQTVKDLPPPAEALAMTVPTSGTGQLCSWVGTSPCGDSPSCPANQYLLTTGRGNAVESCASGKYRALCCPKSDTYTNCEWSGTAPFCSGQCPANQVELYRDYDGAMGQKECQTGTKAFCCDPPPDPDTPKKQEPTDFEKALGGFQQAGTCPALQPLFRRDAADKPDVTRARMMFAQLAYYAIAAAIRGIGPDIQRPVNAARDFCAKSLGVPLEDLGHFLTEFSEEDPEEIMAWLLCIPQFRALEAIQQQNELRHHR
ncbi:hypothetical protein RI367_006367 [Sorochytrium milnesiophthora]